MRSASTRRWAGLLMTRLTSKPSRRTWRAWNPVLRRCTKARFRSALHTVVMTAGTGRSGISLPRALFPSSEPLETPTLPRGTTRTPARTRRERRALRKERERRRALRKERERRRAPRKERERRRAAKKERERAPRKERERRKSAKKGK